MLRKRSAPDLRAFLTGENILKSGQIGLARFVTPVLKSPARYEISD